MTSPQSARPSDAPHSSGPGPLSGISADTAAKLEKLGIRSWFDLLLHLPLRYEDETRLVALKYSRSFWMLKS